MGFLKFVAAMQVLTVLVNGEYREIDQVLDGLGCSVYQEPSARNALRWMKGHDANLVITEFVYYPRYGTSVSAIDSLLIHIAAQSPTLPVVILAVKSELTHLNGLIESLRGELDYEIVLLPISEENLTGAFLRWSSRH